MIGLIKKDLLVLKSNLKVYLAVIIALIFFGIQGNGQNSIFILPMIGIMMFLATFSYDEFNNCNAYVISFPNGRKNVVKSKYISSVILIIILSLISFIATLVIRKLGNNDINMEELISTALGTIFGTLLVVDLLYPLMIKFGAVNGRIIVFAFIMGIGIVGYALSKIIDVTYIINNINLSDSMMCIIILLSTIMLIGISYFISSKIYQKKEF